MLKKILFFILLIPAISSAHNLSPERMEEILTAINNHEQEKKAIFHDLNTRNKLFIIGSLAVAATALCVAKDQQIIGAGLGLISIYCNLIGIYKEIKCRVHLASPTYPDPNIDIDTQIELLQYKKSKQQKKQDHA